MVGEVNTGINARGYQDAIIFTEIPKSFPPAAVPASEHIHSTTRFSNTAGVYVRNSPGYAIVQVMAPYFARPPAKQYEQPKIPKPIREEKRIILQRINFDKKKKRESCEHCIDNICRETGFRCGERHQWRIAPEEDEERKAPKVCKYYTGSQNVAVLVKENKLDECINFLAKRNYKRAAVFRNSKEAIRGYDNSKMDESVRYSVLVCDAEQSLDVLEHLHERNFVPEKIILMKTKKGTLPNIPSYFEEICEVMDYEEMHNN